MDQNIKQRLVGIAVIFSLAVIFLPMILDGSGVAKKTLSVEIPPQPQISARDDFDEKIIELESRTDEITALEPRFVDEKTVSTENRIERHVEDDNKLTGQKNEQIAQKEAEKVEKTEQPAIQVERPGGKSWVLQVGSFKDRKKALSQRDRLRQSKIAAVFIEQFNIGDQASYRVRLGPFIDRDQSKVAQNKIKAKYNIDGLIMKYER